MKHLRPDCHRYLGDLGGPGVELLSPEIWPGHRERHESDSAGIKGKDRGETLRLKRKGGEFLIQ